MKRFMAIAAIGLLSMITATQADELAKAKAYAEKLQRLMNDSDIEVVPRNAPSSTNIRYTPDGYAELQASLRWHETPMRYLQTKVKIDRHEGRPVDPDILASIEQRKAKVDEIRSLIDKMEATEEFQRREAASKALQRLVDAIEAYPGDLSYTK